MPARASGVPRSEQPPLLVYSSGSHGDRAAALLRDEKGGEARGSMKDARARGLTMSVDHAPPPSRSI